MDKGMNEIMMGAYHIFVHGLIPEGSTGCLMSKLFIRVLIEALATHSINRTPRLQKSVTASLRNLEPILCASFLSHILPSC